MGRRGVRWTAFLAFDSLSVALAVYGILALNGLIGTEFSGVVALIVAGLSGLVAILTLFSALEKS